MKLEDCRATQNEAVNCNWQRERKNDDDSNGRICEEGARQ